MKRSSITSLEEAGGSWADLAGALGCHAEALLLNEDDELLHGGSEYDRGQ